MPFQDILDKYHEVIKNLADRVTYDTEAKKKAMEDAARDPNELPETPREDYGSSTSEDDTKKSKGGFQKLVKEK